jgi:hypothetical protein
MEDNTLVDSSFSATINGPLHQIDIPAWCFTLGFFTREEKMRHA